HAPHRVLARRRHGLGDVAQVLEGPAEGELARHELRPLVPRRGGPGGRAERAAQRAYGRRRATSRLASALWKIVWRRVSTTMSSPGPRLPLSTTSRGSKSTSPTSDPATSRPSRVTL